jgi:hypothetical protein
MRKCSESDKKFTEGEGKAPQDKVVMAPGQVEWKHMSLFQSAFIN